MAVRTNATDVKAIMDSINIVDADVDKYIVDANALVNEVLGTGVTTLLETIEKWVTAHLIAVSRERQTKKEEAGGAKVEYTGYWSKGFEATSYGQMALSLDTTGALAELGKSKASIYAVTSFDD